MKMLLTGLVAMAALTFGCAEVPADGEEMGESASEVVSNDVFERASTIVNGINYLAFGYKLDGCYARALYMSAELAARGIESNALYAVAQPGHELVIPGTQDTWAYHVAPMLNVDVGGGRIVPRVLDRSMSPTPLTHAAWVQKMGYRPTDRHAPQLASIDGSEYAPFPDRFEQMKLASATDDVPSFQAMENFQVADLQHACGVMHAYLSNESSSVSVVRAKQERLVQRTYTLLRELSRGRKLDGSVMSFNERKCRSCRPDEQAGFVCAP